MTSRLVCLIVCGAAACGGQTDVILDGGTDDSGNDGTVGDTSPPPGPDCPISAPTPGTACTIESIQCEYGGDPRWTCDAVAACQSGRWTLVQIKDMGCPTSSDPQCPPSFGDIQQNAACTPAGISCSYSTSSATNFCDCTNLGGPIMQDGGGAEWHCASPVPSCPNVRPRLGATCSQTGLECDYSVCGTPNGLDVQCNPATSTWIGSLGGVCAGAN